MHLDKEFWYKKNVLLTGHTGFKGSWMSLLLEELGAKVSGISLNPIETPNLYNTIKASNTINSYICDINNISMLSGYINLIQPQIVIHMAAQAIVLEGYANPIDTISTNVMGTVNLLESLRNIQSLQGVLIVTSDKVYENDESKKSFSENDKLGGYDPYSASKGAAELLTQAYGRSFFQKKNIPIFTARAGNVIGGGDWSKNRLIPDLWKAYQSDGNVSLRNPNSIRPWQHVLDPIYGYLLLTQYAIKKQGNPISSLNFAPPPMPNLTVLDVAKTFLEELGEKKLGKVMIKANTEFQESNFLNINSDLAHKLLGWKSKLSVKESIKLSAEWYKEFAKGSNMRQVSISQLKDFLST